MTYHNAHAALIDENNIVQEVIVIPYMDDKDTKITEYCNGIGLSGKWLDTSYQGSRRKRYARIGYIYDEMRDAFIPPQPYPSWTLDNDANWQPPIEYPNDNNIYTWNEDNQSWDLVE